RGRQGSLPRSTEGAPGPCYTSPEPPRAGGLAKTIRTAAAFRLRCQGQRPEPGILAKTCGLASDADPDPGLAFDRPILYKRAFSILPNVPGFRCLGAYTEDTAHGRAET